MFTYDQVAACLRKHGDPVFKFKPGFVAFGGMPEFEGSRPTPRRAIDDVCRASFDQRNDYQCDFFSQLWSIGVEGVLSQLDSDVWEVQIEFIAGYGDRIGFEYLGDESPEAIETYIGKLEDQKGTEVFSVGWRQNYPLRSHGMSTVDAKLLADWPDLKLYATYIYEGEGWWSSMFFAVRPQV